MNLDRIYSQYRDDALADQITAKAYSTFVAMPFSERFSYRSRQIYTEVIQTAAIRATGKNFFTFSFLHHEELMKNLGVAGVVTEDIIVQILKSHLFLADLTFENPGVLLEVGIALGLKPNNQIILILQGHPNSLHFDIRNNRVIRYDQEKAVDDIAGALIAGANALKLSATDTLRWFHGN